MKSLPASKANATTGPPCRLPGINAFGVVSSFWFPRFQGRIEELETEVSTAKAYELQAASIGPSRIGINIVTSAQ